MRPAEQSPASFAALLIVKTGTQLYICSADGAEFRFVVHVAHESWESAPVVATITTILGLLARSLSLKGLRQRDLDMTMLDGLQGRYAGRKRLMLISRRSCADKLPVGGLVRLSACSW